MTYVEIGQQESINFVGRSIIVDGIWGSDTQKNIIMCFQLACNKDYGSGLDVDGIWGSASTSALSGHYVTEGETQYLVTAVQIALYARGYDPNGVEYPGQFGWGCREAVKKFQSDNGLVVDGIAGIATCYALMGVQGGGGGGGDVSREGDGKWRNIDPNNLANFRKTEFVCQCGNCGGDVINELKQKAQELRDKIGQPMVITDGFRCDYWNRHEGGTDSSLHKVGMAFDMQVNGVPMSLSDQALYREYAHQCGLTTGNYAGGWMHCQIGRSDYDE